MMPTVGTQGQLSKPRAYFMLGGFAALAAFIAQLLMYRGTGVTRTIDVGVASVLIGVIAASTMFVYWKSSNNVQ